jgi:integrase
MRFRNPGVILRGLAERAVAALTTHTLDSAISRWLARAEARDDLRPGTVANYRAAAGHLSGLLGERTLDALAEADIDAIARVFGEQRALHRRIAWLLDTVLKHARSWGWAVADLPLRERIPTQEIREIWLPADEAAAVIRRCYYLVDKLRPGSNRNGAIGVLLCLLTGARSSEIAKASRTEVSLWWRDGDMVGTIRVQAARSKSKKSRSVPLSPKAAAIVARILGEHDSSHLLPSGRVHDRAIGRATIWRQFRQITGDLGIKPYRPHDLRHTFGTLAVQHGVDLYKVQSALGHTDRWMTERYAHLRPQDILETADAVQFAMEVPR